MVRTDTHSSALTTSFSNSSACALCLVKHATLAMFQLTLYIAHITQAYVKNLRTKVTSDVTATKVYANSIINSRATVQGGALQLLAAKLGVATGQHLAQHCR